MPGTRLDGPADVVRHLVAVQSQDYPGAKWAVAQRAAEATDAAVDAAFDGGAFVRTHVLRPTWHFVAPEDLRWLQALTGPRVMASSAARYRQLEIDDAVARQARGIFEGVLRGGRTATRADLGRALADGGIAVDVPRLTHLVMRAELEAVLCNGPRQGGQQTYALVEERIPPSRPRDPDEALAELARRYIAGHGPARDIDLAWWSGLTIAGARRGLEAAAPAIRREPDGGRGLWVDAAAAAPTRAPRPTAHLLPNYDELLVAFRDRRDALHPALPSAVRAAEAILSNVVLAGGLVVGRWRRSGSRAPLALTLELDVPHDAPARRELRAAVERYGRFLGRPVATRGLD